MSLKRFPEFVHAMWGRCGVDDPMKAWTVFVGELANKLEYGQEEFGGAGFDMPLDAILREMQDEAIDCPGWSFMGEGRWPKDVRDELMDICWQQFIAWNRLRRLRVALRNAEKPETD